MVIGCSLAPGELPATEGASDWPPANDESVFRGDKDMISVDKFRFCRAVGDEASFGFKIWKSVNLSSI